VLKCYCFSDSCLIFVGSLHFGGWVDTMEDSIQVLCWGGSVIATCCNLLSPTAREAGKPTINSVAIA
jgi:hypothetical protein